MPQTIETAELIKQSFEAFCNHTICSDCIFYRDSCTIAVPDKIIRNYIREQKH